MMKYTYGLFLLSIAGLAIAAERISYSYNDCLLVDLASTIKIGSNTTMNNINKNVTGECQTNTSATATITLPYESDMALRLNFKMTNGTTYLTHMTLRKNDVAYATSDLNVELATKGAYYMCNKTRTYSLTSDDESEIVVMFDFLKVQAFGVKNGEYSNDVKVCNDLIPSTVGPDTNVTTVGPVTNATVVPVTNATVVPVTNATVLPVTNATVLPVTNATVVPVANTTVAPQTTIAPTSKPDRSVTLDVKGENGVYCIVAKFKGTLNFSYTDNKNKKRTFKYEITFVNSTNGNCGESKQTLNAILPKGWILGMVFDKTTKTSASRRLLADTGSYSMVEVSLLYNENTLPDGKNKQVNATSTDPERKKASVGQSYLCKAAEEIKLNDVKFDTTDFQVEAFRTSNNTKFSSDQRECPADIANNSSNVVPIVVGVVLALLIIVIIIAYLIGRRRNRSGYQSV